MVLNLRDGVTPAGSRLVSPRSERRFGMFLFPFWDVSSCSHCPTYRVTICVKCVDRFPLVRALRLSVPHSLAAGAFPGSCSRIWFCPWCLVLCPRSFRLGFVPLSEASLHTLQLPAHFLVVLHAAASLRVFWPLSWVLPFQGSAPVTRLFLSLRTRRSRSHIPSLAPSCWSPSLLLRWALLTLSCYVLSVTSTSS